MITRSDKVKAGAFVLACGALFVLVLVLVAGVRFTKRTKTYYVRFGESVTGLEPSSTVRYYGVPVGQVSHIGFAAEAFPEIEVTMEIDPDTPIREDTEAILKPQGVTGIYYIDLEAGSTGSRLLKEHETIRARASVAMQLMDVLGGLKQVIENLNGILGENRESIGEAVASIKDAADALRSPLGRLDEALAGATELTADLRERLSSAAGAAEGAIRAFADIVAAAEAKSLPDRVAAVLDHADETLVEARAAVASADVPAFMAALNRTLSRLEQSAANLDAAVTEVQAGVSENRGSIARMLGDLRGFAADLRALVREVRGDPSRLLRPRPMMEREEGR